MKEGSRNASPSRVREFAGTTVETVRLRGIAFPLRDTHGAIAG
jgi:hypothetical protein